MKTSIDYGFNTFYNIDDLDGLTEQQKIAVLEWFARKLWVVQEEALGDQDYYGKSYDPLLIDHDKKVAHSYVFAINRDGGRHHSYDSLQDIEQGLVREVVSTLSQQLADLASSMDTEWGEDDA